MSNVKIFGSIVEDEARKQIEKLANYEPYRNATIRIMPDVHAGKGCTIGTTMTITDVITPNLVGVDIGCLDCSSEFLTPNGWKRMDEFQQGDLVLQYNPNDNSANFCIPKAYIKKRCDKIHIYKNTKGLNMAVSDEHRILVYSGYKSKGYQFSDMRCVELDEKPLDKNYYNVRTAFNIEQDGVNMTDSELRLMVAISADGRIRNGNVEFHFKKERKIARIKGILSALSIEYLIYKHKDGSVSIHFKDKNYRKDLNWVYRINHRQALIVSQECLLWDGHKGYRSFFSTTHKDYADAIQFAFAACGVRAGINIVKYKRDNWKPSYIVTPTRNEFVGINKKSYEEKTIDGYKYCFNVETSYFVARRGNNIFITGNCGMYVVPLGKVNIDLEKFDKVVNEKIPSGCNIHDTPKRIFMGLNMLRCRKVVDFDIAQRSIGSLGGGNHFIELNEDEDGNKYLVIHSGSRNLGVRVCQYYQNIAIRKVKQTLKCEKVIIDSLKAQGREREIQAAIKEARSKEIPFDKDLAHLTGEDMRDYLHDMAICQKYAKINRETIADLILTEFDYMTHNATESPFHTVHNYIEMEFRKEPILRKGAVAAYKNQRLIIPMNMRDGSLICVGKGNADWNCSAPHGAGRLMSRKKAKETIALTDFEKSMDGIYSTSVCDSTIDEAPQAYKPMQSIIDAISDTVTVEKIIKTIYNFKAKN